MNAITDKIEIAEGMASVAGYIDAVPAPLPVPAEPEGDLPSFFGPDLT